MASDESGIVEDIILAIGFCLFFIIPSISAGRNSSYAALVGLSAGVGIILKGEFSSGVSVVPEKRLAIFGEGLLLAAWTMFIASVWSTPRLGVAVGIVVMSIIQLVGPSYFEICAAVRREAADREGGRDIDDREGKSEQSASGADSGPQTSRFSPDNLGRTFLLLFGASAAVFYLSVIVFVGYVWQSPPEATTGIHPVVLVPVISWAGMVLSLAGYSLCSIRKIRRMRRNGGRSPTRNPVTKLLYLLALVNSNGQELSTYDRRARRTTLSVLFGLFFLMIPVAILYGEPGY
ncbi:hypothetical protein [Natrinema salaciae]|uniref:Uncharacterized protein n=1 Tax=Natrinema salaciae TaxID=1186196 RepID=A0A1H9FQW5_9EURY|nr:hypothetical protein [Natrinema salaciae]SEQ40295.1 hypothetical protein SAMN04489841_1652 [Natrinema salaciae]